MGNNKSRKYTQGMRDSLAILAGGGSRVTEGLKKGVRFGLNTKEGSSGKLNVFGNVLGRSTDGGGWHRWPGR